MNLTDNIVIVQEGNIEDPLDRTIDVLSTTSDVSLLPIVRLEVVRFQLNDIVLCLGDKLTDTALRSYIYVALFPGPTQLFMACSTGTAWYNPDVFWTNS